MMVALVSITFACSKTLAEVGTNPPDVAVESSSIDKWIGGQEGAAVGGRKRVK